MNPSLVVRRRALPLGDGGTRLTISEMVRLARHGCWQPEVRQRALRIMGRINGRDGYQQALILRRWLQDHFQFVRDPTDIELLHTPVYLLTHAGPDGSIRADCDDAAILGSALAQAVGLQARLVVVGFLSPKAPFRHVWAEVAAPSGPDRGRWVELDVTRTAQRIPTDKIGRTWIVPVVDRPSSIITTLLTVGVVIACITISGSTYSRR